MAAVFSAGAPASVVPSIRAIPRCRIQPLSIACSVKSSAVRVPRKVDCSLAPVYPSDEDSSSSRRQTMLQILFSAISFPAVVYAASAESDSPSFRPYEDEVNKFQISIPQEWLAGTGTSNTIKSVTAFFPETASDTNVTVVITGIGPDFTRLESFGKVDEFAENLVNGLDRSWQRPPGLAAKLIDSRARNVLRGRIGQVQGTDREDGFIVQIHLKFKKKKSQDQGRLDQSGHHLSLHYSVQILKESRLKQIKNFPNLFSIHKNGEATDSSHPLT